MRGQTSSDGGEWNLIGRWSFFCEAKDFRIVRDTEYHDSWEDYPIWSKDIWVQEDSRKFIALHYKDQFPSGVEIHWRAVAYCHNFTGPLRNLEDGFYQGRDKTFTL